MRHTALIALTLLLCGRAAYAVDGARQCPPTHGDVAYGPHARHVLDIWLAPGAGKRPLLVYVHGGGWYTGDKSQKMPDYMPFLDKGISFAAINYRLTPESPLPAPVHDAARAIQFIRSRASDWSIDRERIALIGPSAGGCTALWLLLHDDLADPESPDPVLRESTRVCAAAVTVPQTSIDPEAIEGWLGPNALQHPMIARAVGEQTIADALRNDQRHRATYGEFSPITHVDAADPPVFVECSAEMDLPARDAGHGIHHPLFGVKLKQRCDEVGHECHLVIPGHCTSDTYGSATEFLVKQLSGR